MKRGVFCLLGVMFLAGCFSPQGKSVPPSALTSPTAWSGPSRLKLWEEGKWFMAGANYPWLHYGHDFGVAPPWTHDGVSSPESMIRVDADFSFLAKAGVHLLRWFVFSDGTASPEFDKTTGKVTGLDESFYKDMDMALSLAERHNIHLVFVLLDFAIGHPAKMDQGVQKGGRQELFSPRNRTDFFNNALKPLLAKYGKHPNIFAWEIMNEPEGIMKRESKENNPIEQEVMQAFIKETVAFVHAHSDQKVTIGSKSRKHLGLWINSGVDFYQYHYYDRLEADFPLAYPYADLNADLKLGNRPTILGEFPTASTTRTLPEYLDTMVKNGYAGAWAWSYGAGDVFSNFSGVTRNYTQWLTDYEATNPALK